jgi:ferredoxin
MGVKKIKIDKNKCIGCGTCAALAPEVFELDENNKARVKNPKGSDEETIRLAVDSCPVQAISIEEE